MAYQKNWSTNRTTFDNTNTAHTKTLYKTAHKQKPWPFNVKQAGSSKIYICFLSFIYYACLMEKYHGQRLPFWMKEKYKTNTQVTLKTRFETTRQKTHTKDRIYLKKTLYWTSKIKGKENKGKRIRLVFFFQREYIYWKSSQQIQIHAASHLQI